MAQLKDTVISGSLRVTDTIFSNNLNLSSLTASYAVLTDANKNLISRAITDNTSATAVTASTNLITANTLYYHKGNSNIVTVGTITTGTWNATIIGVAYGGTGVNSSSTAINKVFASPGSGSAGAPSFRTLVAADVPVITTASDTTNELYMLGVTSSATTTVKYNSGVKAKNGAVTATTYNGLTLTAASTGFTIAGGTTSKTLTVNNTYTLGAACAYAVDDATANGALSTGTGLTTERSVYYGLCIINNASQTRATSIYAPTGAGTAGHVLAAAGGTSAPAWNGGLVLTGTAAASWKASFEGTTEANATAGTEAVRIKGGLRVDKVIRANKVYNAIWNDYAEYREAEVSTPGACMVENDNGRLTIADERLVPGACIISDTYGFCQGETEKANVPIAVTGRVLAYTYWPREMYHAGMAVCSAPNGTIDIMTREEIRDYPDAIVGIVSEIPDYEYWGNGNVKIDNRIWIKVK